MVILKAYHRINGLDRMLLHNKLVLDIQTIEECIKQCRLIIALECLHKTLVLSNRTLLIDLKLQCGQRGINSLNQHQEVSSQLLGITICSILLIKVKGIIRLIE